MPAEEVAFIHDADTEAKKKDLFAKVRTGQVRVLLGSTQKMVQEPTSRTNWWQFTTWMWVGVRLI